MLYAIAQTIIGLAAGVALVLDLWLIAGGIRWLLS
jgi:hypothetical protein